MARDVITKTTASLNAGVEITEDNLATVAGNGGKILCGKDESILIYAENTNATTRTLTIVASTAGYAKAGLGDATAALVQNKPQIIGPLEGARFAQADGYVYLDCHTSATGVIAALNTDF